MASKKDDLVRNGLWMGSADAILNTTSGVGTVGTGLTVVELGDDREHVTVITIPTGTSAGTGTAGAAKGFGKLVYTFPAGAQIVTASAMNVGYTAPTTTGDANKIGLGHVVASGGVSVLNGTATFMSLITEKTGSSAGVLVEQLSVPTASPFTYITDVGGVKTVYLNFAGTWTDTGTGTISGTVTIRWTTMV